jgi:hypothetical protein
MAALHRDASRLVRMILAAHRRVLPPSPSRATLLNRRG